MEKFSRSKFSLVILRFNPVLKYLLVHITFCNEFFALQIDRKKLNSVIGSLLCPVRKLIHINIGPEKFSAEFSGPYIKLDATFLSIIYYEESTTNNSSDKTPPLSRDKKFLMSDVDRLNFRQLKGEYQFNLQGNIRFAPFQT